MKILGKCFWLIKIHNSRNNSFQTLRKFEVFFGLFWKLIFAFILQVMFETYQFSGVYVAIQAVLTLYAQGKQNYQKIS